MFIFIVRYLFVDAQFVGYVIDIEETFDDGTETTDGDANHTDIHTTIQLHH